MSEKPSDTSTPPDAPTLLLDENLSDEDIAIFLRRLHKHWRIEVHADHFKKGETDVEVIRGCAEHDWVLISVDDRIRYVPENKAAALRYKLRAFMFNKGNYQGVEYAAALIVGRSEIARTLQKFSGPFFARIRISGDVNMLEPQEPVGGLTSREKTERKYGKKIEGESGSQE